jgi:plasmid maintenance system antidote protein VapI
VPFVKSFQTESFKQSFQTYFGNSVEFWIGIQNDYEIRKERNMLEKELSKIKKLEKITA